MILLVEARQSGHTYCYHLCRYAAIGYLVEHIRSPIVGMVPSNGLQAVVCGLVSIIIHILTFSYSNNPYPIMFYQWTRT